MNRPSRVVFTDHAAERAELYGIPYNDVADAVLDGHDGRRRNPGQAGWQIRSTRLVVVYEWPDEGDPGVARVVSLWPRE